MWEKSGKQLAESKPFFTPSRLGQIEFFFRTFTLLACGFLFGGDVVASFRELSGDQMTVPSSGLELLKMAMEEQPTSYLVIMVFMLCCTVTCSFAALRVALFSSYMAQSYASRDLPEVKMLDAVISIVQLMSKPGGAGISSGLSLVWQILGAVRAFFDDV